MAKRKPPKRKAAPQRAAKFIAASKDDSAIGQAAHAGKVIE